MQRVTGRHYLWASLAPCPGVAAVSLPADRAREFSPSSTRLGWIGVGVMGRSMCGRLMEAGYATTIFTRSRAKAEPLLERGAKWADSPASAAEGADVVFSMVGLPSDVREVHLGERGTLAALREGAVVVDMSTSAPR